MQYWTIQIKPFPPETRNENVVLNFQTDCIRNNLFGMGWNMITPTPPVNPCPTTKNISRNGWKPALVTFPKQHITPIRTFRQEISCFSEIETPDTTLQK